MPPSSGPTLCGRGGGARKGVKGAPADIKGPNQKLHVWKSGQICPVGRRTGRSGPAGTGLRKAALPRARPTNLRGPGVWGQACA